MEHINYALKQNVSHVTVVSSGTDILTFDQLRCPLQRAYHQCRLWIYAYQCDVSQFVNPTQYGYVIQNEMLVPNLVELSIKLKDLPDPCKCGKCAGENVWPCRKMNIECCLYLSVKTMVISVKIRGGNRNIDEYM